MQHKDLTQNCQSCGTPFKGKFCYSCGEKKVTDKDFSIKAFLVQAIDIFTHFDGKFFNTFRALLFKPGKLTNEFLSGRRVKYMKPLQLYLIIALAFFLFLKDWDIFYGRLQYRILKTSDINQRLYKPGELKGYNLWLKNTVAARAEKKHILFSDLVYSIDNKMPETSKAFAFLMIPWLGLALYMSGFKKYRQYVPHLVHATHLFSFFLTFALLWLGGYTLMLNYAGVKMNLWIALGPIALVFLTYMFISIRRVIPGKLLPSILRFLTVSIFGFMLMIVLYRQLMNVVAVYFL